VRLSVEGERYVAGLTAKKAAVQAFLTDVLNVSALQAEIDSCKIEHLVSEETLERLNEFLVKWRTQERTVVTR